MEKDKISEKEKKIADELAAAAVDATCKKLGCGAVSCDTLICGTFGAAVIEPEPPS